MATDLDIITGDLAARVKRLMLFSRYRAEGRFAGENRSVKKGQSTDFMQHRPYVQGDNLKYIDWRVYARTSRFVVREFEDTTNLDMYLVVDASASMAFAGGGARKYDYAVQAAAILSYLMMTQKDSFGLSLIADSLRMHLAPGTSRRHLQRCCEVMLATEPAGAADWAQAVRQVRARQKRRGLVILVSDFLDDLDALERGLGGLCGRGSDAIAIHIVHPEEEALSQTNMTRFIDVEDNSALTVDPLILEQAYAAGFSAHCDAVRDACTRKGIAYTKLRVGDDTETVLGTYLRHRAAVLM
jgi:uncharacterized protein (DUF58 family)